MAVTLQVALGTTELVVGRVPRQMARSLTGYAGANGLTGMALGTRGYQVPIRLTLRAAGNTYALARAAAEVLIAAVEALQALDAAEYTYGGTTYSNCIWDKPQLLPGPDGRQYTWIAAKKICIVNMSILLRGLI
jgi:hypothetical protein